MSKRLFIYLKEMFPPLKCGIAAVVLFFEIYFLIIFISEGVAIKMGVQEAVGCFTVFAFLLSLRIADDFKDYKTDCVLFPERALPSGKVFKKDLAILLFAVNVISVVLNIIFMNNLIFFAVLMIYGVLMSLWFFARSKIQKNLPLALITHNPVDIMINVYIISFTCIKYNLPMLTFDMLLVALTLYWPCLIWEISRKTRAPEDETEYTTYSKIYGYKKIVKVILVIITLDLITSAKLMYELWTPGLIAVAAAYGWFVIQCMKFMKNPKKFKLVSRVEIYELVTEVPVILIELAFFTGIILA